MNDTHHPGSKASGLLARFRPRHEDRVVSEFEKDIIRRVHDLAELELRDVMTPRVDVIFLTHPVTPEQVAESVRDSGHSCFPVVTKDLDDVDGVLFVNDLFRSSSRRRAIGVSLPDEREIERKIREPLRLTESLAVFEALEEMRQQHRTFAIVMDEHGGVAGVVSTRDLLEPLVGDLGDEFDEDEEEDVAKITELRWLIQGQAHIDKVAEVAGCPIPEGEYVTIGGYIIDQLGFFPQEGVMVVHENWVLRVYQVEKRRILEIIGEEYPDGVPPEMVEAAQRSQKKSE